MHAVRRSTSEVKQLRGERVLPWYKGEGKKMGNTQKAVTSAGLSWDIGFKKPRPILL